MTTTTIKFLAQRLESSTALRLYIHMPALICLAALLLCCTTAFGQGKHETIVKTGDSANGNGVHAELRSFDLNNLGQVVIAGENMTGTNGGAGVDDAAIFLFGNSGIQEIVRRGDPSGNGTYGIFSFPNDVSLNDAGQISFGSVTMQGTNNGVFDDEGLFFFDGNSVLEIAREGDATVNGNMRTIEKAAIDSSGRIAFEVEDMTGTSGGTSDDEAIFLFDGNSVLEIAREGGATGNGNFGTFTELDFSDTGVAFITESMTGTSGGTDDNTAVFHSNGSGVTELVRAGHATANGTLDFFNKVQANNVGQVVFQGSLNGTSQGSDDDDAIFLFANNQLQEIVREGEATADGTFGSFFGTIIPNLNDAGQIAFAVDLENTSTGGTVEGLFQFNGTDLQELARTGDATANGNIGIFHQIEQNNSGLVAYQSILMTGTLGGTTDDRAVFMTDGIDTIEVRRLGDIVDGLTVTQIQNMKLNELGQVAMRLIGNSGDAIELFTPDLHWRPTTSSDWGMRENWTLSINPGFVHDVFIDSAASVTVSGPTVDTTVGSLEIGGGNGLATLELQSGAVLTAANGVGIRSTGTLTGDGVIAGNVTNRGTIVAQNLSFLNTVTNESVIRGNGRIHANIHNDVSGEIRVGNGERMMLTGPNLLNDGRIENIQGELEIDGLLQNNANTGLITGRDSTFRFNGGLNNDGGVGLSFGVHDIFGDVANNADGVINVSGGSQVTFYDDLIQNGTLIVGQVGNTTSSVVMFGEFSGSGGFTGGGDVYAFGDLRPGNSPASVLMDGNLFLSNATDIQIELAGTGIGEFDQLVVTGDLALDGMLDVDLIDGFQLLPNMEFLIADVSGELFGQFNGLNEGDWVGDFNGLSLFISYSAGDGNDISLYSIPEPNGLVAVFLLSLLGLAKRRKRTLLPR